ncbi:hypothetical protein [Roseicyclus sp.]|uniref:hypothetical protein n=1 Tax=Roseicyclus sp. TaxID=1914329 RepID=UPI0026139546|nr:hypothetical protein [Roseicyclus sp.]
MTVHTVEDVANLYQDGRCNEPAQATGQDTNARHHGNREGCGSDTVWRDRGDINGKVICRDRKGCCDKGRPPFVIFGFRCPKAGDLVLHNPTLASLGSVRPRMVRPAILGLIGAMPTAACACNSSNTFLNVSRKNQMSWSDNVPILPT